MFAPLNPSENSQIVLNMRHCFVGSKMTNLKDLEENYKYFCLNWTEFLELICRVSMYYFDDYPEKRTSSSMDIDDQVFVIL